MGCPSQDTVTHPFTTKGGSVSSIHQTCFWEVGGNRKTWRKPTRTQEEHVKRSNWGTWICESAIQHNTMSFNPLQFNLIQSTHFYYLIVLFFIVFSQFISTYLLFLNTLFLFFPPTVISPVIKSWRTIYFEFPHAPYVWIM